jgi:hypothetical protein
MGARCSPVLPHLAPPFPETPTMPMTASTRPLARATPAADIPGVPAHAHKFRTGKNGMTGAVFAFIVAPPKRVRASRLNGVQARAAKRLSELARLASWRARYRVLSELRGWALVAADALAELEGTGEWRHDHDGVAAQLPPGTVDADAIAAALVAPRRPERVMSNREAGRLVELVKLEADDADIGKPFATLTPRDLDDDALAARRLHRRREAARERKRRARAKCVTCVNVTFQPTSNVTFSGHAARSTMERDAHRVTNGSASHEITAATVAAALAINPGAARARLLRWYKAGVIQQAGRGHYLVVGHAGGPAAPPLPPAPDRPIAMRYCTEAAQASDAGRVPPCG